MPFTVNEAGVYYDDVPVFAGARVLDDKGKDGSANGAVIGALVEAGRLLAKGNCVTNTRIAGARKHR